MTSLIDITGDDIAKLDDTDLRTLVGRLCEADYSSCNLSISGVTYGGHQDASDGGLDVVVESDSTPKIGFISRMSTGIQVKKSKMPRAEIIKEMRPNGVLRDEIKSLIGKGGAYFIVSSGDSTTHKTLTNRKDAMREAIEGERKNQKLLLDFLDRDRVATWVRRHPSIILWVRDKIGIPIAGWQGYDNWSNSPGGIDDEYLCDEGIRVFDDTRSNEEGYSIEMALADLRSKLTIPRQSVRMAGLSGVGKTRFAQALFDGRIGANPLDKYQVFYTDISDSPQPEPRFFAEQLIACKASGVLIIDNCSRELHERLTTICSKGDSRLSLLTIEYDVREHVPEETHVIRLEPASKDLVSTLIENRFPYISQVNARSIAEFSGGNARIAIALASTIEHGESVAGLKQETLFERLFHQRHDRNDDLITKASALSLVYSFDGVDTISEKSELAILGSTIGKTSAEMYQAVSTLKERELVQSRSMWRAVLPHAIANRLAKRALQLIPKDILIHIFLRKAPERLLQSFTRRLGYLHDCDAAIEIAQEWMKLDGWIGSQISELNAFGMTILKNIAPVAPEMTLKAIEHASNDEENGEVFTSRLHRNFAEFTRLLRQLAYDKKLFPRCAKLLCRYAASEVPGENHNSIRDILKSLFYIHFSGTHASPDDRALILRGLISSTDETQQQLGILLLGAALESWHFSSAYQFNFGARSRDYGYSPSSREEVVKWYSMFIDMVVELGCSDAPISKDARICLANCARGLWVKAGMHDALVSAARTLQEKRAWSEGWIAVRGIRRYDGEGFDKETVNKLNELENLISPNSLIDKAIAYITSDNRVDFDLGDDFDDENGVTAWDRAIKATEQLGEQVGKNEKVFQDLLPELVISDSNRIHAFGMGLAKSASSIKAVWEALYQQYTKASENDRQIGLLMGYLGECGEIDPEFFHQTLDRMVTDETLGIWFPTFQTAFGVDSRGLQRLHQALDEDRAFVSQYKRITWIGAQGCLSDNEITELLEKISTKEGGIYVAIEILTRIFYRNKNEAREYSTELIEFACNVLATFPYDSNLRREDLLDHDLDTIAAACLAGDIGEKYAHRICSHVVHLLNESLIYSYGLTKFLGRLASLHPYVFLDCFAGSEQTDPIRYRFHYLDCFEHRENPLNHISDEVLISWCNEDFDSRYLQTSYVTTLFKNDEDFGHLIWKPLVYEILEKVADLKPFLDYMSESIRPRGWSGSLASLLEKRSVLYIQLFDYKLEEVRSWANIQYSSLLEEISNRREYESKRRQAENETFE